MVDHSLVIKEVSMIVLKIPTFLVVPVTANSILEGIASMEGKTNKLISSDPVSRTQTDGGLP
jgi:hypothetical protein